MKTDRRGFLGALLAAPIIAAAAKAEPARPTKADFDAFLSAMSPERGTKYLIVSQAWKDAVARDQLRLAG